MTKPLRPGPHVVQLDAEACEALRLYRDGHPSRRGVSDADPIVRAVEAATPVGDPERGTGSWCAQCGPGVPVDEDGCCATCGATAMGDGAELALAVLRAATPVGEGPAQGVRADIARKLREMAARANDARGASWEHGARAATTLLDAATMLEADSAPLPSTAAAPALHPAEAMLDALTDRLHKSVARYCAPGQDYAVGVENLAAECERLRQSLADTRAIARVACNALSDRAHAERLLDLMGAP